MSPVQPDLVRESGDNKKADLVPSRGLLSVNGDGHQGTDNLTTPDQDKGDVEASGNTRSTGHAVPSINPDDFPGTESPVPQGILTHDDLNENATIDVGLAVKRARYQLENYPGLFSDVVDQISLITCGGATVTWANNKVIERFERIVREKYDSGQRQGLFPLTRAQMLASRYCHPCGESLPAVRKQLTAMGVSCFDFGDPTFKICKELQNKQSKYRSMFDELRRECFELESIVVTKVDTCAREAAKLRSRLLSTEQSANLLGELGTVSGDMRGCCEGLRRYSKHLTKASKKLRSDVGELGKMRGEINSHIERLFVDFEKSLHKLANMVWVNIVQDDSSRVCVLVELFDPGFKSLDRAKARLVENFDALGAYHAASSQDLKCLGVLRKIQARVEAGLANIPI
ncbi:hypothetical protein QBC41DRAFT_219942 [Cercophora samala]|uniref:Uncharacterized protein n=1 Tax=Cercophora samala TaxID=330535 RepID=A0AA39ZHL4_9PEZI|nr:hypothetical protein QBC41DRAFT_219942 [Cercophora samala]